MATYGRFEGGLKQPQPRPDTSGNPMHGRDRTKMPKIDRIKPWQTPDIDKAKQLPYRPGSRLNPNRYVDVVEAFVKRNR